VAVAIPTVRFPGMHVALYGGTHIRDLHQPRLAPDVPNRRR
jgi:hypothetical protein